MQSIRWTFLLGSSGVSAGEMNVESASAEQEADGTGSVQVSARHVQVSVSRGNGMEKMCLPLR